MSVVSIKYDKNFTDENTTPIKAKIADSINLIDSNISEKFETPLKPEKTFIEKNIIKKSDEKNIIKKSDEKKISPEKKNLIIHTPIEIKRSVEKKLDLSIEKERNKDKSTEIEFKDLNEENENIIENIFENEKYEFKPFSKNTSLNLSDYSEIEFEGKKRKFHELNLTDYISSPKRLKYDSQEPK
jgi:hypothetical protein